MRNIRTYAAYWWSFIDNRMDGEVKYTEEFYDGWSFRAVI